MIPGDSGDIFEIWSKAISEIKKIGREVCGHEWKNLNSITRIGESRF